MMKPAPFLIAALLAAAGLLQGQEARGLKGTVVNAEDRQPIVGANVVVSGTVLGTTTGMTGEFLLRSLPPGDLALEISMIGFRRKRIPLPAGSDPRIVVELEPAAVQADPIVITANRREQSLEEVPASVSVIDDRALAYRNTVTIDDALKYVPGITITRSQVNVRGSTGFSYGVGTRVLLLVDGLPFLSGDTGEIIWESLPPGQIDRVEVVKGAGSALYGSSALGGVINVITRRVRDQPETQVRSYAGTYELPKYASWQWTSDRRTFAGLSMSHSERVNDLSFSVGASRSVDDGYKRNDFWKRWNGWGRADIDLSAHRSLGFSFSLLDQRRGSFLYWKDLDHALEPKDAQLNDRIQSLRWNVSSRYREYLSSRVSYAVQVSWFSSQWEDNLPTPSYPTGSNSSSDAFVGELQATILAGERQILTAGFSGTANRVSAERIFGVHESGGGAAFVQDEISLAENAQLTAGARFDVQSIAGLPAVNQFNPKLGLVYRPSTSFSLRTSAGRGFRAPSVAEVYTTTEAGGVVISPNPGLLPERSWSFELGGTGTLHDNLVITAALFQNELWDLIEPAFGTAGTVQFRNVTRARITGAECSVSLSQLDRSWITDVSCTIVNPQDLDNGVVLKYRPRQTAAVATRFLVAPFQIGADYRYSSRMERIDDEFVLFGIVPNGDERVPISVVDLHLRADWKLANAALAAALHVNNLLQYYYADFIGNLGPTRNYVLSLGATF